MPPENLDALRKKLFANAVKGMSRRIDAASDASGMLENLRWGMREVDRALTETPKAVQACIACRAGCSACCSVPVDAQAHEVFLAADYLQTHLSPPELAAIIDAAATHRKRGRGLTGEQRSADLHPCVLLKDGNCSIYEARPEICRAHHTSDASACEAFLTDSNVDIEKVYIPPLRARLYAVMLGLDEAIESAGFDNRSYDFGSALHEALTNSLCQTLWLRHKPAFPDSCLSAPFSDE